MPDPLLFDDKIDSMKADDTAMPRGVADIAKPDASDNGDGSDDDVSSTATMTCPLFMEGLPSDFASNPQLAALASLLGESDGGDDDDDRKDKDKSSKQPVPRVLPIGKAGGGKVRTSALQQRQRRHQSNAPYQAPSKTRRDKASMVEAQLFMKMWKL